MRINHPTHVVTITVWEPATHTGHHLHCWVDIGPFALQPLDVALREALEQITDHAIEIVEERQSVSTPERSEAPPWEQLNLL